MWWQSSTSGAASPLSSGRHSATMADGCSWGRTMVSLWLWILRRSMYSSLNPNPYVIAQNYYRSVLGPNTTLPKAKRPQLT